MSRILLRKSGLYTDPHFRVNSSRFACPLFYPKRLVRRWGRIGSRRPRSIRMMMADPDELARQVAFITKSSRMPRSKLRGILDDLVKNL